MPAKRYLVAGRELQKFADSSGRSVHVIDVETAYAGGDRAWQHRMLCGRSLTGVPVTLQRVTCRGCRKAVRELREPCQT